jgi:dipeptidyl aminopeptidase/acylaminoacyl peptidase
LLAAVFAAGAARAQEPSLVSLDDVHRLAEISEPVFSANGASVLYTLTTHNLEEDETVSDIWSVPYAGGRATNLTGSPNWSEWRPQPSATGGVIAFLSDAPYGDEDEDDAETQVWIMAAEGEGDARRVTSLPGGISDFTLSPDGKRLVVAAEVGSRVDLPEDETPPPIVIDRFQFKEDGRGYLDDRRQHLFLVNVAGGKPVQLTSGDFDHWLPEWSPDGTLVAFVSKRRGDPDRNLDYDVFVMPPEAGAEARPIGEYAGADNDPSSGSRLAWSPDGTRLAWLRGGEDRWLWYAPMEVAVGDVATGEAHLPLVLDRWLTHPRWSVYGGTLFALREDDRATHLIRLDPSGAPSEEEPAFERLTDGARFAYDFAVGPAGELVVLDGDDKSPYELRAIASPEQGGEARVLTTHNAWLKERRLGETREVTALRNAQVIHGLLLTPPGYDGEEPLPLIVRLHGGPVYQFSHELMLDWQVYAAQGYAVLGVNPRGSSGRGFDYARAIYADWGGPDGDDVIAMVEEMIAQGVADPERIGVGGWSYGGILTNYVIARDQRFKAAVSGAGMGNMLGGFGVDQYAREYELELGLPWESARAWRRVSRPFLEAFEITTPTLFLCAEADDNVPCAGSEQMYQALRSLEVETRLVVYPGENHGLTVPSYIHDRLERSLQWYDEHLLTEQRAEAGP